MIDGISFYASCEQVFRPDLRLSGCCVLSNNDGAVVALNRRAKELGVKKFEPYFKQKNIIEKNNIHVFSSNYELYGDMSARMMSIIEEYGDRHFVYSIDESFIFKSNVTDWFSYARNIRRRIWKELRLPVGVGVGSNLTLCKLANHCAKKVDGYRGIAIIDDEHSRKTMLEKCSVEDVWGIGRRLSEKFKALGVNTAFELSLYPPKLARQHFNVNVERTIRELNGEQCLSWDDNVEKKKQIFSTRSFGQKITCKEELKQALINHGVNVAQKARKQNSHIKQLLLFASSCPFDQQQVHFKASTTISLPEPLNDPTLISKEVSGAIDKIYKQNVVYKKCGVGAVELVDSNNMQLDLLSPDPNNQILTNTLDSINSRFGKDTVKIGSQGVDKTWEMKREFLSPAYTTRWKDIPKIKC